MRGGHNALSTPELEARGTLRKHRHEGRLIDNAATVETLDPPEHLDSAQKAKFQEVCDNLAELGVLTLADRDAITAYIETLTLQNLAWLEVQKNGVLIESEGKTATNPAMRIYLQCDAVLKPLRERFGFDPRSRQGLKTKKAVKRELDPMAAILKK